MMHRKNKKINNATAILAMAMAMAISIVLASATLSLLSSLFLVHLPPSLSSLLLLERR
jgi:hypothetical protein